MGTGAITQYVDVAQLVLYAFWIFFAGLIYYLVRENHREGYPMETENGRGVVTGWPIPEPKTYKLAHGGEVVVPNLTPSPQTLKPPSPRTAGPARRWCPPATRCSTASALAPGPIAPTCPDMDFEGLPKIVPLRTAPTTASSRRHDPRGLPVVGADGEVGGTVVDLWVDTAENLFRYLEVEVPGGGRNACWCR
jgi:photosynthetic reaction center H subunit